MDIKVNLFPSNETNESDSRQNVITNQWILKINYAAVQEFNLPENQDE